MLKIGKNFKGTPYEKRLAESKDQGLYKLLIEYFTAFYEKKGWEFKH
jgi:hypothetical protein